MVSDLVIYPGTQCNFNCTYCDRDYIKEVHGYQKLTTEDLHDIFNLIESLDYDFKMLSFHGGEPFVFTKLIDKIITWTEENKPFKHYYFQTNGSLILNNKEFITKWKDKIIISISYDFNKQEDNRTGFDMEESLEFLKSIGVPAKLQSVVPMDGSFFDSDTIHKILRWKERNLVYRLGFVPLKYIRSVEEYKILLDDMSEEYITAFFFKFIRFLQTLVLYNIEFHLDGVDDFTEDSFKDYSDPVELIVSPDGYMYSEFDFLDYRQEHLRFGKWRDGVEIYKDVPFKMMDECKECTAKNICGLKYARQEFDLGFKTFNCRTFLTLQQMTFKHITKLRERSLLEHVGI